MTLQHSLQLLYIVNKIQVLQIYFFTFSSGYDRFTNQPINRPIKETSISDRYRKKSISVFYRIGRYEKKLIGHTLKSVALS